MGFAAHRDRQVVAISLLSDGQNHRQDDLQKLLAARPRESGNAPYCTNSLTAPPSKGSFLIF